MLGGVQRREEPLPRGECDGRSGGTGTRGENATAKQRCLYQDNVSVVARYVCVAYRVYL